MNGSATTVFPGLQISNNTIGNQVTGSVDQVTSIGTRMGVLLGDVNATRAVNAADVSLVKSNLGSGVSPATFRSDVNTSGAISAADVSLVKSKSGNGLP